MSLVTTCKGVLPSMWNLEMFASWTIWFTCTPFLLNLLNLSIPKSLKKFSLLSAINSYHNSSENLVLDHLINLFFLSLFHLILDWYCNEKYSFTCNWEIEHTTGDMRNLFFIQEIPVKLGGVGIYHTFWLTFHCILSYTLD